MMPKDEMSKKFLFKFRINPASIKLDVKLGSYWFLGRIIRHPDTRTAGITNRCADMLHYVLFLDFDHIYYETMKKSLLALQTAERMSDIVILKTSEEKDDYGKTIGSYHAYEFSKRKLPEILRLMYQVPVDPNSLRVPRLFSGKAWVLRTEPKTKMNGTIVKGRPEFKEVLESFYRPDHLWKRKQSLAHYLYLRKNIGIPMIHGDFDKETKIQTIEYTTTSRRWKTHWLRVAL
jgi:hypothetical protein